MTPATFRQTLITHRNALLIGVVLGLVWGLIGYWVLHMHWFPLMISAALMGGGVAFWALNPRPGRP